MCHRRNSICSLQKAPCIPLSLPRRLVFEQMGRPEMYRRKDNTTPSKTAQDDKKYKFIVSQSKKYFRIQIFAYCFL